MISKSNYVCNQIRADATTIVVGPDAVFAVVVVTFACEYEFALIQTDTLNELPNVPDILLPNRCYRRLLKHPKSRNESVLN